MRGADAIARTLRSEGVERIFTLSGNQIMPVFDACVDAEVELLHVRQEAAAVHMADAWGRLTGLPGVALVTAGPGFANTLSALYVATMSESPMVLLSGRAPLAHADKGPFQEMPQAEMATYVSKASWTAQSAVDLHNDIRRAFDIAASGRPGPVHIALPFDVIDGKIDASHEGGIGAPFKRRTARAMTDADALEILAEIRTASAPLVLAGSMMTRGDGPAALADLCAATGAPIVQMESPRGTNDPALGAFAEVLAQADLIVLLGKKLDFTLKMGAASDIAAHCRFIQIDPDPSVIALTRRNVGDPSRIIATVQADPLASVRRMARLADGRRQSNAWAADVEDAVRYRPPSWQGMKAADGSPLRSVEAAESVRAYLAGAADSVFVCDGGEWGQWAQAVITSSTRIINGPAGAIGASIPFAITARLARPSARVVTVLGDGTAGFHIMEYDTAVRYGLSFVGVVGNDAAWNAEYQIQLREYGPERLVGCELLPSRYDRIVDALGGHGEHVESADALPAALERAGASGLPALLDVRLARDPAPVVRRADDAPQTSSATLH